MAKWRRRRFQRHGRTVRLRPPATSSRAGKGKSELTATTNHQLAVKRPVQPFDCSIAFFGPSAGMSSARADGDQRSCRPAQIKAESPRAFLIWEIWAKADICGQNTITATPRISPTAIISVARFGRLCGRLSLILVTKYLPSRASHLGPTTLEAASFALANRCLHRIEHLDKPLLACS
jgi:hypothetical protein